MITFFVGLLVGGVFGLAGGSVFTLWYLDLGDEL